MSSEIVGITYEQGVLQKEESTMMMIMMMIVMMIMMMIEHWKPVVGSLQSCLSVSDICFITCSPAHGGLQEGLEYVACILSFDALLISFELNTFFLS